jgi:hypothetical protein
MRSAYVIKIELNTKLIFTDLEDNRVSINGLDNVTITVSWNSDIVESQTCSSLSHVVCATLQNQKCMDQLIPMISQKVIESIKPTLKKMVDDSLLPHIEKIQIVHHDKRRATTEQLYHLVLLVLLKRVVDQGWMQVY